MTSHEPASGAVDASVPDQRVHADETAATGDPTDVAGNGAVTADPAGAVGATTGGPATASQGGGVLAPEEADGSDGPGKDDADRWPAPGRPDTAADAGHGGPGRRGFLARLAWGPADDPRWARPALWVLLAATAVLYLGGLGRSGWANAFYSAAAQAGSVSWKALFYGSSDAGNAITVDKPPVAMWLMSLSVRIFGLSSWSILVPEALCGVASVGLLYATVRRAFSPAAGL